MKLTIDRDADALYLNLDETLAEESRGFSLGVILDYNAGGKVVGIEMLHLSKRSDHLNLKAPELARRIRLELPADRPIYGNGGVDSHSPIWQRRGVVFTASSFKLRTTPRRAEK